MENQKCYTIYIHIFPNLKTYVGLTKQQVENRWANGEGYKNQPVYEPIKFYGWENIKHIIIKERLTKEEAQELEKEFIKKYDSINFGYNYSEGGGTGGESWNVFEYNNQRYSANELAELSPLSNLTGHDITNRINEHGWDIEKALSHPKQNRNIKYNYNGKEYTLKELYAIRINKDLTYSQIRTRINKYNWDIERALTQPSNIKKQPKGVGEKIFEYNGKKYNSYELTQISPIKDLTPFDITNRINKHGWSVEKAITQPKKSRHILFEYKGQVYDSNTIINICCDKNLRHNDITDRYRNGWSVEEIICIPKGMTRKQFYDNNLE